MMSSALNHGREQRSQESSVASSLDNGDKGAEQSKFAPRPARPPRRPRPARAMTNSFDAEWTFLTNHSHVLLCLATNPDKPLREVAAAVGITERSVQRIVRELEEAGYLERERAGRRNRYRLREDVPLRHPIEGHCTVGDLIEMVRKSGRR